MLLLNTMHQLLRGILENCPQMSTEYFVFFRMTLMCRKVEEWVKKKLLLPASSPVLELCGL